MASQFIPPNGFAGFAQQTAAVQQLYRKGGGAKRRKKKATRAAAPRKKRAKRAAARGAGKFVKGSAAAKAHMARLRKMRKKR